MARRAAVVFPLDPHLIFSNCLTWINSIHSVASFDVLSINLLTTLTTRNVLQSKCMDGGGI
jgi:hypothetical protein